MIRANGQTPAKAKFLVALPATGALLLFIGLLLSSRAHAFEPKDLERVLQGRDCPGCDLSGADLFARNLANINLSGANLSRAKLSLSSLKSANLSRANLSGVELASSFLFGANLTQANLSQAILDGAYLHQANLEGAILAGADLSRAYLFDANFKGTNLNGAKLEGANLSGTNLELSNLQKANLGETIYDSSTRFPSNFSIGTSSLTTVQPKPGLYEPPDRRSSRLAEIHQLSLARVILTMGAADANTYGGSKDKVFEQAAAEVNQRLVKLKREIHRDDSH